MKGLILKDFHSIIGMKNIIIIFMSVGIWTAIIQDTTFIVSFIPMMVLMLSMSSFTYDEYNKWDSYALTMPVNRKMIVASKYLFVLILLGISFLICTIIAVIFNAFKGNYDILDTILAVLLSSMMILIIFSLILPFVYKYGAEKGRFAMFGVVFAGMGIAMLLSQFVNVEVLISFLTSIESLLPWLLIALAAIVFLASYQISYRFYLKKEF